MVLVFILLGIFIILITFVFLILLSTIHIEIKDLELTNMKENKKLGYGVILSLYLGKHLKWISVRLNDEKLRKAYNKMQLEKIDLKKLEQDFKWEDLSAVKKIKPKISYLDLKVILGTENAVITAFINSAICIIISVLLPYIAIDLKKENYKYYIEPIYINQNLYKIQFNCIIQVKVVHIINVILFINSKRLHLKYS